MDLEDISLLIQDAALQMPVGSGPPAGRQQPRPKRADGLEGMGTSCRVVTVVAGAAVHGLAVAGRRVECSHLLPADSETGLEL